MSQADSCDRAARIRLLVTDVDGVLTDGGMYYSEAGDELKKFNVRDGVGVRLLKIAGLKTAIMTGERTTLVERRGKKIGVDAVFTGVENKRATLDNFRKELGLEWSEIAFVGDELNDFVLLGHVGYFFCPSDANPLIRQQADEIVASRGGAGVLRDVAMSLLTASGQLQKVLDGLQHEYLDAAAANVTVEIPRGQA